MRLLHLSDIHFRKGEIGTAMDPNLHLRTELLRDAERFCSRTGVADALIVSGDIAFAGDADEYEYALKWLEELCGKCGTSLAQVFVIPGNHDVVRKTTQRPIVQSLHRDIKAASDVAVLGTVRGLLSDAQTGGFLYESIAPYNFFASQFFCDLLPPERTVAKRDLRLNDGSILRLCGLNSTFTSGEADVKGSLFYDPACLQITREYGVEHLVACHHPYNWLRQGDSLKDHLNDIARIHLFGHEHTSRIEPARDWVRIAASAAHPDRNDFGWEPGYNIIDVEVRGTGNDRRLYVGVHVRIWQSRPGQFRPKMDRERDTFEQEIRIDAWSPPEPTSENVTTSDSSHRSDNIASDNQTPASMDTLRNISICFFKLSFSQKSAIAGKLNLLEEEDINQPDFERFRRVFLRAQERGLVADLDREVKTASSTKK